MTRSLLKCVISIMVFLSLCVPAFAGDGADPKQLPEKYFAEDYLYGICFIQGLNETIKAIESLDLSSRRPTYVRYLEMANEYESMADNKKSKDGNGQLLPDDQRRYLLIALNCFELVSKSSVLEIKGSGEKGIKRCREKLLSLKADEFEDQFLVLQRCIDIDQSQDVKKKEEKLLAYYQRGKEYEDKADKSSDNGYKKKNYLAALDFYGIVVSFTKDKDLKKQAGEAKVRCIKAMIPL
ncbi:MAG: hypothetical protein WC481_06945 [Candidatus Omnitrophota bacterium]